MKKFFIERHEQIKKSLEDAQGEFHKASTLHNEYQTKLTGIEKESSNLIELAKKDGTKSRDEIIKSAKNYASKIRHDSDSIIDHELSATEIALRNMIVKKSIAMAASSIRSKLNEKDKEQLLEQAIKDLEQLPVQNHQTHKEKKVLGGAA